MLSLILISEQVISYLSVSEMVFFLLIRLTLYKSNQIFSDLKAKILSSQVINPKLFFCFFTQVFLLCKALYWLLKILMVLQPVDQHQRLSACFDSLMTDISRGLDQKNRDKFTQNLTLFRHEFRVK